MVTCKDSGGPLEFVGKDECGLVSSINSEEIGDKINSLYNNESKAKELGNAGFNKVKDISWDNVIEKLTSTL